jgi:hypothetical protein
MSPLTLEQVLQLTLRQRVDYLCALPEQERLACLRAFDFQEQALYLGELARRALEEHRRAALEARA